MHSLNSNFPLKDKGVSNALTTSDLPRHRWYFVKEGFSPRLVEEAISTEGLESGELLLDPFSGSGTAPLTAATAGLKTVGFEVNPFLRFLSATKLVQIDHKALKVSAESVLRGFKRPQSSPLEGFSTFASGNPWNRWLFNRNVLRSYEGGNAALDRVPRSHRNLLKLLLLGATLDCCNATRDGKCLRYRKNWRESGYNRQDLIDAFDVRLKAAAEDLEKSPLDGKSAVILQGDARQLIQRLRGQKFRLCITSPPYLNSFDYSDVYRPELFLGRFVDSNEALMKVRLRTIRSHVQANWDAPKKEEFGELYRTCIEKIHSSKDQLWSQRLPLMIQAYFEDMERILGKLRKRALPNASAWFVVSTSAYVGVEIPVDLILAEIGQKCGWYLREIGVLRYLRSSGQQMGGLATRENPSVPLRESVVILDASQRRK